VTATTIKEKSSVIAN